MNLNFFQQILLSLLFPIGLVTCMGLIMLTKQQPELFMPNLVKKKDAIQVMPEMLKGVKTVACIGDSITFNNGDGKGFPERLKTYFDVLFPDSNITVLNKGIGGEHAYQMLSRFEKDAISTKADLIIILAGVNDVGHRYSQSHPAGDNPMGSSLETYLTSMKSMIELAKKNQRKVIVVTPPTIYEDQDNSANKMLGEYSQSLMDLAKEEEIPVADVRKAFVDIPNAYRESCNAKDYLLTVDGVHPNSLGNKVITECLLSTIGIEPIARRHIQK